MTPGRHADEPARAPSKWSKLWGQRRASPDVGSSAPRPVSTPRAGAGRRSARHQGRRRAPLQDEWSAAAARANIPASAVRRLGRAHPEVPDEHLDLVGEALLQRVRIEGRKLPVTYRHAPPSRAVEGLWQALRADPDDWAAFAAQFPADLGHLASNPGYWMPGEPIALLRATWTDAAASTQNNRGSWERPPLVPVAKRRSHGRGSEDRPVGVRGERVQRGQPGCRAAGGAQCGAPHAGDTPIGDDGQDAATDAALGR